MNGDKQAFCNVGDVVEPITDVTTTPPPGEPAALIRAGARYTAVRLVGAGWG